MFTHILIPTDGSPVSFVAVEKALAFARDAGAKVTILTVVVPLPFYSAEVVPSVISHVEYESKAREHADASLTSAELKARALGVPCEVVQRENDYPYRAIISAAEERGCDLIAMGSHGRGGLGSILLGSETVEVLTHTTIPLLVYR